MRWPLIALATLAGLALASPALASEGVAIVAPTKGVRVSGTVSITAAAPAGTTYVQFSWSADGATWNAIARDADSGDGWEASWDTRALSGLVHVAAAASGGTIATISVTVDNASPVLA